MQWGPKGIRVNSLCPGYMKTNLIIELLEREGKHIEEGWVKDVPMGRLGHPSELQGTIVWMASDASSYLYVLSATVLACAAYPSGIPSELFPLHNPAQDLSSWAFSA